MKKREKEKKGKKVAVVSSKLELSDQLMLIGEIMSNSVARLDYLQCIIPVIGLNKAILVDT